MNDIYEFDVNELFPDNRNNRNNGFDNIIISFIIILPTTEDTEVE